MKRILLVAIVFLGGCGGSAQPVLTPAAPARATVALPPWPAAWTTFHFSNRHAGLSPVKTPYHPHPAAPAWTYATTGSIGAATAVGAGGLIYVPSSDGSLYALNPDGSMRWRYRANHPQLAS